MPPRGRNQMIQGQRARSSVAMSMPRWKATATSPAMIPMFPAYSTHFKKDIMSQMWPRTRGESCMILSPFGRSARKTDIFSNFLL